LNARRRIACRGRRSHDAPLQERIVPRATVAATGGAGGNNEDEEHSVRFGHSHNELEGETAATTRGAEKDTENGEQVQAERAEP
jgi:hypothetical protein